MALKGVCGGLIVLASAWLLAAPASAAPTPVRWCGTDAASTDRLPDSAAGAQVHVVYAYPSDGNDRFATLAHLIATDLGAIDAWWRAQDSSRAPRFDLFAFPGCDSRFGSLDLTSLRLPQPGAFYAPEQDRFQKIRSDVAGTGNLTHPFKKYLVYYDGPLDRPIHVCGTSSVAPTSGGTNGYSIAYIGCDPFLGQGRFGAVIAAHELIHSLGALVRTTPGPPHTCPGDLGHPCDDPRDILNPSGFSTVLEDHRLDAARDDYYDHPGSWWDVRDSSWLSRLDAAVLRLTVAVTGNAGTVSSDLPGIAACATTCSADLDAGTQLTLTATPAQGSSFRGWTGTCAGIGGCAVTMDAAKSATAVFWMPVRLIVDAAGNGTVTSTPEGVSCPPACSQELDKGSAVTLTARPGAGARFTGWTGDCSGLSTTCALTLDAARNATATFAPSHYRLTVAVTGRGLVGGGGIRCRPACSALVPADTAVRLIAKPQAGWRFSRWGVACAGTQACAVRMSAARRVTGLFVRR